MRARTVGWVVVTVIITAAIGIAVFAPRTRPQVEAGGAGDPPPETIEIVGTIRDFRREHPDFAALPAGGFGNYVGLVEELLRDPHLAYAGPGHRVITPATDEAGRTIAAHLANREIACGITDFEIIDGKVIPGVAFAARFTVLGAAITSGGADTPVTVQGKIGGDIYEPFGPYADPIGGDVNDDGNPRHAVLPDIYPAGTPITIAGRSWLGDGSGYAPYLTADSDDASPYVLVLRDGSPAPDIEPFEDQAAAVEFVRDYIDTDTGTMTLARNQAIFLFEIGVTDLRSSAADFQDLVVIVTLARRTDDLVGPSEIVAIETDTEAVLDPTPDAAAITGATTFGQWYRDIPGTNMSTLVPITFVRGPDDVYVYDDQLDPRFSGLGGFFPIDDRLLGSEGDPNNRYFTYELSASFVYDSGAGQFLKYTGDGDVWIFVDGQLAIDLGGVHGVTNQRIDVDRLCLQDGATYWIRIFNAQRWHEARVRIETNIELIPSGLSAITNQYD